MGITMESWLLSFVSATLFAIYRIYEPDVALPVRKRISIVIMGFASALLVPGVIVYWLKIENAFVAASFTGIFVYTFERAIKGLSSKVMKKIDNENGNDTTS